MPLSAQSIKKTYGHGSNEFIALKGVNFTVNTGESVAIIGKSGSGKSTLMHILATLDRPDSGDLRFEDQNLAQFNSRQLDRLRNQEFGFIFQQFFLNGRDSVVDNVALPLKIGGIGAKIRKQRALEALGEVDLLDKAKNKANALSGGQKQRVCIARAIVAEPKVLFADEPTGNLDTENGRRVIDLLFSLNREKGITLIIVTHDEELAQLCDRRLHMKDGQLSKEQ